MGEMPPSAFERAGARARGVESLEEPDRGTSASVGTRTLVPFGICLLAIVVVVGLGATLLARESVDRELEARASTAARLLDTSIARSRARLAADAEDLEPGPRRDRHEREGGARARGRRLRHRASPRPRFGRRARAGGRRRTPSLASPAARRRRGEGTAGASCPPRAGHGPPLPGRGRGPARGPHADRGRRSRRAPALGRAAANRQPPAAPDRSEDGAVGCHPLESAAAPGGTRRRVGGGRVRAARRRRPARVPGRAPASFGAPPAGSAEGGDRAHRGGRLRRSPAAGRGRRGAHRVRRLQPDVPDGRPAALRSRGPGHHRLAHRSGEPPHLPRRPDLGVGVRGPGARRASP
jgi:hypothetical protein